MNAKQILCPVDFSSCSQHALQYASTLAKESHAKLHILFVQEDPKFIDRGFAGYVAPDNTEAQRKQLEKTVPSCPEVEFTQQLRVGNPETEIVTYAQEHAIDLIVLGSHGRTGLRRTLMGSVAEGVVRRANCPVLTTKQPLPETEEVCASQ